MPKEYLQPRRKANGNPNPKRGDILRGILASIAKTVVATTKGEGEEKEKEGGQVSSASTTPPRSSYLSEGNLDG